MILFLDSAAFEKLQFALIDGKKIKKKTIKIKHPELEQTAANLEKFLRSNKVKLAQISKVIVAAGEGSFTGIRVGIALALAFKQALAIQGFAVQRKNVPKDLRDLEKNKLEKIDTNYEAEYGKSPNITIKKTS